MLVGHFRAFLVEFSTLVARAGGEGTQQCCGDAGGVMSEEMEHRGLDLKFAWVTVRPGAGLLTDGS